MALGDDLTREWADLGTAARQGEIPTPDPLPWDFHDTVFRCAWEYTVADFEAEVGFHLAVLGLATIAVDEVYALFTTSGGEIQFACRRADGPASSLDGHRLTLMTRDIERLATALSARLPLERIGRSAGSPVRTVITVTTPAGLTIDVWEDPGIRDDP
jgi:hypothetical protein